MFKVIMDEERSVVKSKEQRVNEIKPILEKLGQMHLKVVQHPELQQLMVLLKEFINDDSGHTESTTIKILFPILNNCTIDGELSPKIGAKTWVRLTANKN
jgi:hypothetical protein